MTELENGRPQNCGAIPNRRNRLSLLQSTSFVWKLSSHFEYLENRSGGLHITWQPVKGDLIAHSPVGLVSQQWDTADWACLLCDRRIHNDRVSRSTHHDNAPRAGFFGKTSHHPGLSAPLQPGFGPLRLLPFPEAKFAVEREEICKCNGHTVHKLSQWHLTAEWLILQERDCSWKSSKVSSDWLPSYTKAMQCAPEIFNMVGYFPDRPQIQTASRGHSAP